MVGYFLVTSVLLSVRILRAPLREEVTSGLSGLAGKTGATHVNASQLLLMSVSRLLLGVVPHIFLIPLVRCAMDSLGVSP